MPAVTVPTMVWVEGKLAIVTDEAAGKLLTETTWVAGKLLTVTDPATVCDAGKLETPIS